MIGLYPPTIRLGSRDVPHNGVWCNGSTSDFESDDLGSNPGTPALIDTSTRKWHYIETYSNYR